MGGCVPSLPPDWRQYASFSDEYPGTPRSSTPHPSQLGNSKSRVPVPWGNGEMKWGAWPPMDLAHGAGRTGLHIVVEQMAMGGWGRGNAKRGSLCLANAARRHGFFCLECVYSVVSIIAIPVLPYFFSEVSLTVLSGPGVAVPSALTFIRIDGLVRAYEYYYESIDVVGSALHLQHATPSHQRSWAPCFPTLAPAVLRPKSRLAAPYTMWVRHGQLIHVTR